ncbi:hypothetical protein [Candidatus Sneabacter namystus]|nr:hypothetical protein [Candidatus Sneabacter namystus]
MIADATYLLEGKNFSVKIRQYFYCDVVSTTASRSPIGPAAST